jgi:hypothetical protein
MVVGPLISASLPDHRALVPRDAVERARDLGDVAPLVEVDGEEVGQQAAPLVAFAGAPVEEVKGVDLAGQRG